MKKTFIYISILVLSFLFILCGEESETKQESRKIVNLLNDKIVLDEELGIKYQTPYSWEKMSSSLSEKFVARMSGKDKNNFIVYSPKSFFYEVNSSSLLRIGSVSLKNKSVSEALTLEQYVILFNKYNPDLIIKRNNIQFNQLEIIELRIEKGDLISYKTIFHNHAKEIIQLDFSISKKNISKLKPSIDASIRSIKLL